MAESTPAVTQIAGMTYHRRDDGIYVFRFSDSKRTTADAWSLHTHQSDLEAAANNEHLRILLDIRGIWLTPYIIGTAIKTANATPPGLRESTAVVVQDNLMMGLMVGVMRKLPLTVQASTRMFTDEAEALTWLTQRLEQLHDDHA